MTTVKDAMSTRLETVDANASPVEAARRMRDANVGDVLVTENGRLRGIVTDRDLVVRCMAEQASDGKVGELCSSDLVTISPDDDLQRARALMTERAVRRLPVTDGDTAVGILALGDLALELDPRSALGGISAAPSNH